MRGKYEFTQVFFTSWRLVFDPGLTTSPTFQIAFNDGRPNQDTCRNGVPDIESHWTAFTICPHEKEPAADVLSVFSNPSGLRYAAHRENHH
jgi:hypothetical protein